VEKYVEPEELKLPKNMNGISTDSKMPPTDMPPGLHRAVAVRDILNVAVRVGKKVRPSPAAHVAVS